MPPWFTTSFGVMTGQHDQITLSFMIPGHTKFSPDWCFGLLKKRYRRTKVGGLTDLIDVVNQSAIVNAAQPTGSADGRVVVPTYDWLEFFMPYLKKVTGIKKLHHLRFKSASPGCVFVKERAGSEEVKRCFLKKDTTDWKQESDELPPVLPPAGLSLQRQWYLHDKIREFCPDNLKKLRATPNRHLLHLLPHPPPRPLPHPVFLHPLPPQRNRQLSGHDCVDTVGNQGIMLAHAPATISSVALNSFYSLHS